MAENLNVFDFALTEDEMKRIAALKRSDGRIADPAGRAPAWD
jgi:diketogulonate reductase-like aldo/keto reductase